MLHCWAMVMDWLAQVWRDFERGVLGKGRPRVGSRRRDRMPRAMAPSGAGYRPVAARSWGGAPERTARGTRSTSLPYSLMFAAVMGTIILGLFVGLTWAGQGERGIVGAALGAATPTPAPVPTAQPTLTPTTLTPTPPPVPDPRVYVVEPGDTLGIIAEQHGTTIDALIEANDLDDGELLEIGQELVIPGADGGRQ